MSDIDDNLTWYIEQTTKAQSRDRLDFLAETIQYAKWEDEPWTKDVDGMKRLRDAWSKRATEIEQA